MENEFNDEPRKCSNCGIVTYCDSCPICGKKLARSSASTWKRKYGKRTAGEDEDLLQTSDTAKLHEHIDIRDSQNAKFNEADHIEPNINFHSDHVVPNHPYFNEGNIKEIKNSSRLILIIASIIAVIIGIIVIIGVGFNQFVTSEHFFEEKESIEIAYEGTFIEKEIVIDGDNTLTLGDYSYSEANKESSIAITNTGNRSMRTDVIFYNNDNEVGRYEYAYILPNEQYDIKMYSDEIADSYAFVNCEFYDISSTKPTFEYTASNYYGSIDVFTDASVNQKDLEILLYYMWEASSFDAMNELRSLNVYGQGKTFYEVYVYEEEQVANVYVVDENDDVIDSFDINLSGNNMYN